VTIEEYVRKYGTRTTKLVVQELVMAGRDGLADLDKALDNVADKTAM
jgi:hypothetical protein